ncbi:MAG TPA: sugar O-acetyltransferase [Myxococcota bacterium]|nr:sugar O-acetyltransferase [Myxococcota bacterium]HNZ03689.1 sugar O-acetyltransferase [Myxococcota bacterium]HOD07886.1 sugar O-acetyltransferase [Myxococcota bacterium]HPB51245.1 sugar O-acetyltransferase [Myxococcota bacterium]HQP95989.1 sugar O-acetyltransferase [Myxococcota bacterium]
MTEMEKMLAGMPYDTSDPEVQCGRNRARRAFYEYNTAAWDDNARRTAILKEVLGACDGSIFMEPPIHFDFFRNTYIGRNFYSNYNLVVLDCAPVHIGDDVMIGPNVTIVPPMHALLPEQRNIRFKPDGTAYDIEYAKPVTIGNNVWIAAGVIINGGVTIGSDAVIGSGSVVTRDIPPGVFAAGNPCRVLRPITAADRLPGFE